MTACKRPGMVMLILCLGGAVSALDIHTDNPLLNDLMDLVGNDIGGIESNPKKFIRAFADAAVFANHGATQRAYGDYKTFAFTLGTMVGARLPGSPLDAVEDLQKSGSALMDNGDINAGVNIQAVNVQLGIPAFFLPENRLRDRLYFGIHFGYFKLSAIEDLEFTTFNIGLLSRYQLFRGVSPSNIWQNAFRWRGIAVGTGISLQQTNLSYTYALGDFEKNGYVAHNPKLQFDMTMTTVTIPLEINTSAMIFWFLNFNFGLGVDFAFGRNNVAFGMTSQAEFGGSPVGSIWAEGGGTMSPTPVNPKVMFNMGCKFGPIIVDIPITWYFTGGSGINTGVTLGAVW